MELLLEYLPVQIGMLKLKINLIEYPLTMIKIIELMLNVDSDIIIHWVIIYLLYDLQLINSTIIDHPLLFTNEYLNV